MNAPARLRPRSPGEWVGLLAACLANPAGAWCVPLAWCPAGPARALVRRLHALTAGGTAPMAAGAFAQMVEVLTPAERDVFDTVCETAAACPELLGDGRRRRIALWDAAARRTAATPHDGALNVAALAFLTPDHAAP